MSFATWVERQRALGRWRHGIPWAGGLFIATIASLAVWDIVRGYHAAADDTDRELETQARVIAEQTARSVQAIDVVLRHVASEYKRGRLARLGHEDLHTYLRELSLGLKQIDGFGMYDANGAAVALSWDPSDTTMRSIADLSGFRVLRDDPKAQFGIGNVFRADDGVWAMPLGRRLEKPSGEFAGVTGARGLVTYFQDFYRDIRADPGTRVTLLHRNGALLARFPPLESTLGKKYPPLDSTLAARVADAGPFRMRSPIDGVESFAAARSVPDYPLGIIVSRDVDMALAAWRKQVVGTAGRTLALAALAVLLLAILAHQLRRLDTAHASLEASRERYALAVAGSGVGIWDWDLEAGLAFDSALARKIQGLPPGPELQRWDNMIGSLRVHPDDAPLREERVRAHLAGETPAYEVDYRVRHGDGEVRWVQLRALCIRNAAGKPTRMAGSVIDITERKRTEQALLESEQRYELAVAGSNEGMWDWDMRSETFFFSARAQELFGLDPGAPMRPCAQWWGVFGYHPDDEQRVQDAMKEYLDGAGAYWEVEYRIRHRRTDQWHWYRERGVALRDEQGKPYRMAGSIEDITERKNAEVERGRLEAQLRQSQKLEAMGTLAGGIAHDFNNILAAILGYGEMVQHDCAEGTSQRRHIDAALSAALRAKSLVERILAFSRSGTGERIAVNVQAVIDEALLATAASLPPGVRLESELNAGDAAVLGDPTQIHQVAMNLCANAVHAMRASGTLGVSLRTTHLAQALCVSTAQLAPGAYIKLAVRDTGSGIAPQLLERIFDPFFTTKGVGVGTGLGLSLVHGIVADLGGGIDVHSHVGDGSTFTVYLPWQGSAHAAQAQAQEAPVVAGNGQTILLVDDEEALVRLGEEMIAEFGYEAVGFASSIKALETFRETPHRFDAVLSDEAMPEMTGCELAREIRRIRPDIPIVLMSGYVTPALLERAQDFGAAEVLAKPLAARDMARCLADALVE